MRMLYPFRFNDEVEGRMSEEDAASIAKIHAWREFARDIASVVLFRFGVLILLWKSPELAELLVQMIVAL